MRKPILLLVVIAALLSALFMGSWFDGHGGAKAAPPLRRATPLAHFKLPSAPHRVYFHFKGGAKHVDDIGWCFVNNTITHEVNGIMSHDVAGHSRYYDCTKAIASANVTTCMWRRAGGPGQIINCGAGTVYGLRSHTFTVRHFCDYTTYHYDWRSEGLYYVVAADGSSAYATDYSGWITPTYPFGCE